MTENEWMKEFGQNLKVILSVRKITQNELANTLGLAPSTISYYVSGLRMPSVTTVINMSYILDCGIDELVDFGTAIE